MKELIQKLRQENHLSEKEWVQLLDHPSDSLSQYVFEQAREVQNEHYGNKIYIRGLIEFTNYCKNDCYYCGIQKSNPHIARYRLDEDKILACCHAGYEMGFRTFVLQGGEDGYYTDARILSMIRNIKERFPDCAITLSIGEKSYASYKQYFDAGADRYLLRHETYNWSHYSRLHPPSLTAKNRQQCLWNLKEIGYQVGTGFMVGSPYQTTAHVAEDLLFLEKLQPHMVGMGPFIPHHDTCFASEAGGSLEQTLFLLGLIRLLLPKVLLPATTALGTIHPRGRELGILAGANVVMPNISPKDNRKDYALYDNKISTGEEALEGKEKLVRQMHAIGYEVVTDRGDSLMYTKHE